MKRLKVLAVIFLGVGILIYGSGIIYAKSTSASESIRVDFKDTDLKEALRVISRITKLDIIIEPNVEGQVTARFVEKPVPVKDLLQMILDANDCQYEIVDNLIKVSKIFCNFIQSY